jgi:protein O-mannosyl-transferase
MNRLHPVRLMETMRTAPEASMRVVALLALLAIVPHLNALAAGFTFDDIPNVRNNPAVTGGVDPIRILGSTWFFAIYRPFTVLTFAINEALAPGNAAAFHAVNVVLHAGVTVLVFLLALRLFASARIAVIAAALFAVHPIHTEAVTSIVGRAELLAALFGLAALWSAARSDSAPTRWTRRGLHTLSLVSFTLALFSKESALTLLVLIPLFRVACRRQPLAGGLWGELRSLDWVPYALCAGAFVLLRYAVVGAGTTPYDVPLNNVFGFVPAIVRVRSAIGVLWDYFGLLNVPLVLAADYSYNQVPVIRDWIDARWLAGAALIAAAAVVAYRNRQPSVTFAVVFPFVAMSLTANVLFPIGTVKAERLLYFPSVGWALLAAYGWDRFLRVRRSPMIAVSLLSGVIALFGARTWMRNWDWKDTPALYASMVRGAPWSAKARFNFGVMLRDYRADHEGALVQFRRAMAICPLPDVALAIGMELERKRQLDEALEWYAKASAMAPGFGAAYVRQCTALLTAERFEAAAAACRTGLRYDPADPVLLEQLGWSLIGVGESEKGNALLRRARQVDGRAVDAHAPGTRADALAGGAPREGVTFQ